MHYITEPALAYYVYEAMKVGVSHEELARIIGYNINIKNPLMSKSIPIESVFNVLKVLHDSGYQQHIELKPKLIAQEAKNNDDLHFALCSNCSDVKSLLILMGDICKRNMSNINYELAFTASNVIFYVDFIDNKADFFVPQSLFVLLADLFDTFFNIKLYTHRDIEVGFTQQRLPDPDCFTRLITDNCKYKTERAYIKLPKKLFYIKNERHNPYISDYLNKQYRQLYNVTDQNDLLISKIVFHITSDWSIGESPNIAVVANKLGMSKSKLYRELISKNLTFSEIVESQRRDYAIKYIKDKKISIAEISDRLGYANVSAFTRAFYRWFNVSPSQMR